VKALNLYFVAALLFTGCVNPSLPSQNALKSGSYQGVLTQNKNGSQIRSKLKGELTLVGNSANLSLNTDLAAYFLTIILIDKDHVALTSEEFQIAGQNLQRENESCFVSVEKPETRLCASQDTLTLEKIYADLSTLNLNLNHYTQENALPSETPQTYTLQQIMDRARTQNFDTRLEFEQALRAHHTAANTYLNLIPHLSINSILALTKPADIQNLVSNVGDLAPFLLPSRWLKARDAQLACEAEQDALILMRGDTSAQVEASVYAIARDQAVLKYYNQYVPTAESIAQEISRRENEGSFPLGTVDTISGIINALKTDQFVLRDFLKEEKDFFSYALGFFNPHTVADIDAGNFDPSQIAKAPPLSEEDLAALAQKGFEIKQINYLIEAARVSKKVTYFNWLDPSGDPSAGLGAGLGESIAIEETKVDSLLIRKQQIQASLNLNASLAVGRYNESIELYKLSLDDLYRAQRRVERIVSSLKEGRNVTLLDLISALQDRLKVQIVLEGAVAGFRIAKVKIDRIGLDGFYANLSTDPKSAMERP